MYTRLLVFACKLLIKGLRLIGRNGSALPGLIIEKLDSSFLEKTLKSVQKKIIIVTGTNGKTTATKMLVTVLRATGKTVVTNNTGSNMTRGLISTIVDDMSLFGSLRQADWFVFEMDEAYAPRFTSKINPKLLIALNVLRDQLDRYGEIDKTAKLIEKAASHSSLYVYNGLDPLLRESALRLQSKGIQVSCFSISSDLLTHVENEQSLHNQEISSNIYKDTKVVLNKVEKKEDFQELELSVNNNLIIIDIPLKGFHNALNAAAVATGMMALDATEYLNSALHSLSHMKPPFGRGEVLELKDKHITVALVKNPSGFMSNLETFVKDNNKLDSVIFAVNDKFADGRDVSWLWDVRFKEMVESLSANTKIIASGSRGYDMALRLKYDGIDAIATTNIKHALNKIMSSKDRNILIVPTYTALFEVRNALAQYGKVPKIW